MRRKSRVPRIRILRNLLLVSSLVCLMMLGSHAQAQTAGTAPASSTATSVPALNQSVVSAEQTPGSPTSPTNATAESGAGISGTVTAPDGHVIVDALVTLVSNLQNRSKLPRLTEKEPSTSPSCLQGHFK